MRLSETTIVASTVGHAWVKATREALRDPEGRVAHLPVVITNPTREDSAIRQLVGDMLAAEGKASVTTVVNTIFPVAMARQTPEPVALTARYRACYDSIRRASKYNRRGTYFGRLAAHPAQPGGVDQLSRLVTRLQAENQRSKRRALYEASLHDVGGDVTGLDAAPNPQPIAIAETAEPASAGGGMAVYSPAKDTIPTPFPCLSHLSYQLDNDYLHCLAHYRSQYLIERAYGNYLGLGLLLDYIAKAAGLRTGRLMVIAGYASIDIPARRVLRYLQALDQLSLELPTPAAVPPPR
jgi:hypothetical protein